MSQLSTLFTAEIVPFRVKLNPDSVSVQLVKVTLVAVVVVQAGTVAAVRNAWLSCALWGTPAATATLPSADAARSSASETMVVAFVPSGLAPNELEAVTELFAEVAAVCSAVVGAWAAPYEKVFESAALPPPPPQEASATEASATAAFSTIFMCSPLECASARIVGDESSKSTNHRQRPIDASRAMCGQWQPKHALVNLPATSTDPFACRVRSVIVVPS